MKKRLVASAWWFVALLIMPVIGLVSPAQAQKVQWASLDNPIVKEITAKEKMWADGNCSHQPALKDVIADDFQGTAPNGTRFDKSGALADGANWPDRECQLGSVKVQFFGDNLAMAYGSESSIRKGKDGMAEKRCLVWTDTWLKRDGKWQIIAAQDTEVKCQ